MQYRLMDPEQRRAGKSPLFCVGCGRHFTKYMQVRFLECDYPICPTCRVSSRTYADVAILPSSAKFVKARAVYSSTWYHATRKDRWMQDVLDADPIPLVHIGTRYSALDRAKHAGAYYLYRLRVDPLATIHPLISKDKIDDWNEREGLSTFHYDIYRYTNMWESPGSISLLVKPTAITVVDHQPL